MNMLIEFVMFFLMLPVLGLYAFFSLARAVVEFFGAWFVPGSLCIYLGVVLTIFGQPDPSLEWETIIQRIAGITIGSISLPTLLVIAGALFLGVGGALRLKGRKAQ